MAADATSFHPPSRLNANDGLVHGGTTDAAAAAASLSNERTTAAAAAAGRKEFAEILAPLEAEAGKRLSGMGLRWCVTAFEESREGFARCAEEAFRRAEINAVGLLVRMVRDGDHLQAVPPAVAVEKPPRRRRTGWRMVRGSHGFSHVRDPEGNNRPPADA